KKFGTSAPSDFKEKARQMRFLQYRGFEQDHIQSAF
ncbi:MAG: RecX family transcriptional regulator, partial [Gammaproteobacteria bacterium]|nr:RecX family transcriptional regulator [Gammaproteobacteria bacterium]